MKFNLEYLAIVVNNYAESAIQLDPFLIGITKFPSNGAFFMQFVIRCIWIWNFIAPACQTIQL